MKSPAMVQKRETYIITYYNLDLKCARKSSVRHTFIDLPSPSLEAFEYDMLTSEWCAETGVV